MDSSTVERITRSIVFCAVGALVLAVGGRGAQQPCAAPGEPAQIRASMKIGAIPWSIEVGREAIWIATRNPGTVQRIDPQRLAVRGSVRLGFDPWDLAAGSSALWVAPNGADGRLRRVDLAATRVRAKIGGGRIILSNFVAAGAGRVWAGTDERVAQGRGVFEIDPSRNTVVGRRIPTASDIQDIVVGFGSVWVADHSAQLVTRIDPTTRQIIATIGVAGAPHGLAVGPSSVWVALYHESQIQEIDPATNALRGKPVELGFPPLPMAADERSLWVAEAAVDHTGPRSRLVRLDLGTRHLERSTIRGVIFDLGMQGRSLWVGAGSPSRLVRIC